MADVFISYSRKNSDFARKLTDRLRQSGKESWVDWEGIPLSSPNWWNEIKTGIEQGDSFVFIMSPDSMASVVCNMELDYALDLHKRVIIVLYREVELKDIVVNFVEYAPDSAMQQRLGSNDPLDLARENWQRISHINWLYFRDWDERYIQLALKRGEEPPEEPAIKDIFDESYDKLITTVETDLPYVKVHTRYLARAKEWQQNNKQVDLLLFGEEIEIAEAWLKTAETYAKQAAARTGDEKFEVVNPLPDDLHRQYITASRTAETERQQRLQDLEDSRKSSDEAAKNARRIGVVAGVIGIVAIIAGIFAALQAVDASNQSATATVGQGLAIIDQSTAVAAQDNAVAEQQEAQAQNTQAAQLLSDAQAYSDSVNLANRAQQLYESNPPLGLRLAYEATLIDDSPQAELVLSQLAPQRAAIRSYKVNNAAIQDVVFSPDGNQFLSRHRDNIIILWDTNTGRQLRQFEGYGGSINSVVFSPDGTSIASGSVDNALILWEINTGRQLRQFQGHSDLISSVAFSPDGTKIVSGSIDSTVILWDAETGEQIRQYRGHSDVVWRVSFNRKSNLILSDGPGNELFLWDANSEQRLQIFEGRRAIFNPSGSQILVQDSDSLSLWDVETGDQVISFQGIDVADMVFTPDGTQIITTMMNSGILDMWDAQTGEQIQMYSGYIGSSTILAISSNGNRIVSDAQDNTIILWNTQTGEQIHTYRWHDSSVGSIAISSDGSKILSSSCARLSGNGCEASEIILWDTNVVRQRRTFRGDYSWLKTMAVSPDGTQIVSGGGFQDHELMLWNTEDGALIHSFEDETLTWSVEGVAFSPDGTQILASGDQLVLWDIETKEITKHFADDQLRTTNIAFSPDGLKIVSSSYDTLVLWDVATEQQIYQMQGHNGEINTIMFSPDGSQIISGSGDGTLILWDAVTGDLLRRFDGHSDEVTSVAFSPDGTQIISGSADTTLMLWNIDSNEYIKQFQGHLESVNSVVFSPDGNSILSSACTGFIEFEGCVSGEIILWDIDTGEPRRIFEERSTSVNTIMFTPDGNAIVYISSSRRAQLALWHYDSLDQLQHWVRENRYMPELTCQQRVAYGTILCSDDIPPEPTFMPTRTQFPMPEFTPIATPTSISTQLPNCVGRRCPVNQTATAAINQATVPVTLTQTSTPIPSAIGIMINTNNLEVIITGVFADSPADEAGLRVGDIIRRMDGTYIWTDQVITTVKERFAPNDIVTFEIERDGETLFIELTLGVASVLDAPTPTSIATLTLTPSHTPTSD